MKKILSILLMLMIATSASADISMLAMNTGKAKSRIEKGEFQVLYRGFGSRNKEQIISEEALGLRFLLNLEHDSHGLRSLISENQAKGMDFATAVREAKKQHGEVLKKIFTSIESLSQLYTNEKNAEKALAKQGVINPESHFIFTTPRIEVARMYGPIVLVIEEKVPRGMDLNGIAKDAKYYSVARFLKNLATAGFKYIAFDYITDRDEYVIPSYVPMSDITGMIVHGPSPKGIKVPNSTVVRIYRKYMREGAMTIDVVDSKDRLIARLSASPSASVVSSTAKLSDQKLPEAIRKVWDEYVASIRTKYKK